MTYEKLAKVIANRVLNEVVMNYPVPEYELETIRRMDDWLEIFDRVFGELVEQDEAE